MEKAGCIRRLEVFICDLDLFGSYRTARRGARKAVGCGCKENPDLGTPYAFIPSMLGGWADVAKSIRRSVIMSKKRQK